MVILKSESRLDKALLLSEEDINHIFEYLKTIETYTLAEVIALINSRNWSDNMKSYALFALGHHQGMKTNTSIINYN